MSYQNGIMKPQSEYEKYNGELFPYKERDGLTSMLPMPWHDAIKWKKQANEGKDHNSCGTLAFPNWSWGCSFRLDYDGGIVRLNSRFWPESPDDTKEPLWNGVCHFSIFDVNIIEKTFPNTQLDQLRIDVETWVNETTSLIASCLSNAFPISSEKFQEINDAMKDNFIQGA